MTPEELWRTMVQVAKTDDEKGISSSLQKSNLYEKTLRRKTQLKESHTSSCLQFATSNIVQTANIWKKGI